MFSWWEGLRRILEPLCRVGVRTGESTEQGELVESGRGSQMAVLETFGQEAVLAFLHRETSLRLPVPISH